MQKGARFEAGKRQLSRWKEKDYSLPRSIHHLGEERFNSSVSLFPFPWRDFKDEGDFSWYSQWNEREGKKGSPAERDRLVVFEARMGNGRHRNFLSQQ